MTDHGNGETITSDKLRQEFKHAHTIEINSAGKIRECLGPLLSFIPSILYPLFPSSDYSSSRIALISAPLSNLIPILITTKAFTTKVGPIFTRLSGAFYRLSEELGKMHYKLKHISIVRSLLAYYSIQLCRPKQEDKAKGSK